MLDLFKRLVPAGPKRLLRRLGSAVGPRRLFCGKMDDYLQSCQGVIHVGANAGQERDLYAVNNLDVLWIEPIPEIFQQLTLNTRYYIRQKAIRSLITDKDGVNCVLHIANNNGQASSILPLNQVLDIWPDVTYQRDLQMQSETLPSVLYRNNLDPKRYNVLVLDTQGTELMILRGAQDLLSGFHYIKTEAADFESYTGCAKGDDIIDYLSRFGFRLLHKEIVAHRDAGGSYFELLFGR